MQTMRTNYSNTDLLEPGKTSSLLDKWPDDEKSQREPERLVLTHRVVNPEAGPHPLATRLWATSSLLDWWWEVKIIIKGCGAKAGSVH